MASISKTKSKASKTRPASTAAISQPLVEDASLLTSLSAFSQDGLRFAYLQLAVDKHRLRVYNTETSQSLAEHTLDTARVSALLWASPNFASDENTETPSPSKKKRKKRHSLAADETSSSTTTEVVVLGLTDGTISLYSPSHDRVLRTLSHPSSSTPILSLATSQNAIWSSSADGTVRSWDIKTSKISDSWKTDDRISYTTLTVRPNGEDDSTDLLAAHHNIRLLTRSEDGISSTKSTQIASFTGHASSVKLAKWADSHAIPARFITMAEGDRFLYVWDIEDGTSTQGKASASIPLDSDPRTFSITTSSDSGKVALATLSASGKVSVYPIPEELTPPASTKTTFHKIPTLLPRSSITAPTKNSASSSPVINVAFSSTDSSTLRIAQLAKGVRPVFSTIKFVDDSGSYVSDIVLEELDLTLATETDTGISTQRYAEGSANVVGSAMDLGLKEPGDDDQMRDVDGDLEVDLAELSLGQRLTALNDGEVRRDSDSEGEDGQSRSASKKKKAAAKQGASIVPANSLTRTLIQALHSSDSRLLEACLSHSDTALIQNTVKRLPPQLVVPLVVACTERLGRGARAANMKGGGGGASSQRGTVLVTWIKTALAMHAGHLMTIPDLVARLSGLYTTINARLALHENLLQLNGKLDMVLSQVEMRSSVAPAPLTVKKGKGKADRPSVVKHYVEGESESSDAEGEGDVLIESGDDEGSIEDVELGGESDEEGSEEEDEDSDDSEEEGSLNGFIDDEAEEEWSDDEEDGDESD